MRREMSCLRADAPDQHVDRQGARALTTNNQPGGLDFVRRICSLTRDGRTTAPPDVVKMPRAHEQIRARHGNAATANAVQSGHIRGETLTRNSPTLVTEEFVTPAEQVD